MAIVPNPNASLAESPIPGPIVEPEDGVVILEGENIHRILIQVCALLALTVCSWIRVIQYLAAPYLALGFLGISALMWYGFWRVIQGAKRHALVLKANPDGLSVSRNGEGRVIPYAEIRSIVLNRVETQTWLRIDLENRETVIQVSRQDHVFGRLAAERYLIRRMGPHLGRNVATFFPQGSSVFDQALLTEHYNRHVVTMVPGKTYRYVEPARLEEFLGGDNNKVLRILAVSVLFLAGQQVALGEGLFAIALFVLGPGAMGLLLPLLRPKGKLCDARNDRFVLLQDGLEVTRGSKSWIERDPELAVGFGHRLLIADRPVVRYGRWWKAYYFDPRLIEPDV